MPAKKRRRSDMRASYTESPGLSNVKISYQPIYYIATHIDRIARQIGNWRANGERNSEPTKVGGIIVARAVRPSFSTKYDLSPCSGRHNARTRGICWQRK